MNATIKQLVDANNKKRLQLNEENVNFYEEFLVYVRSAMFKDERVQEEVLLEMLDHFIEAQAEGKTAQDIFGKNPKHLADEVIASIPQDSIVKRWQFSAEILFLLLGCYTLVNGVFDMLFKSNRIVHVGNIAVITVILVGVFYFVMLAMFKMLQKEAFVEKNKLKFRVIPLLIFILGCALLAVVAAKMPLLGVGINLGHYGMLTIGGAFIIISIILKKVREAI